MYKSNHKLFFEADAFDIQHTKGEETISYEELEGNRGGRLHNNR